MSFGSGFAKLFEIVCKKLSVVVKAKLFGSAKF